MSVLAVIILLPVCGLAACLAAVAYRIGTACRHKWTALNRVSVRRPGFTVPFAYEYHLRCEHCGTVSVTRL